MKDKYVLKTRICSVLLHVFLLLMVAIILLPVCWLVLNSLKTNQEMFLNSLALPKKWMFVNYATAWGKGFSSTLRIPLSSVPFPFSVSCF